MKKSILRLAAIITFLLLLASCAGSSVQSGSSMAMGSGVDGKKFNIGVSWQGATNDWASSAFNHFDFAFNVKYKDFFGNVDIVECNFDDKKQIADVENLLIKGIDLLLIQPISEVTLATVIEKAKDSGIPVVVFGGSAGTDAYDSYIERDNYQAGYNYAEWMGKRLEGKGNIVVVMGFPGSGYSNDVLRGVDDALKNFSDIKILGTEYASYSPANSKQIIESYLAKGDEINGVIVDGGLMNFGVLEAFTDAEMEIPPTTADDWMGFIRKASDLDYTDFFMQSSGNELALDSVDTVVKILKGEEVLKDDKRAPLTFEGEEALSKLRDDVSDGFWIACQIPEEYLKDYYSK